MVLRRHGEPLSRSVSATSDLPLPEAAENGGWEGFGIVGRALEAEELAKTRTDLVRRVEARIRVEAKAAAA